jgi:uncharacterized protein (TIGR02145 family)
MKIINTILLAVLLNTGLSVTAQIAISTDGSAPDSSAMVDVNSNAKGVLPPRMTTVQMSAINNPVAGLIVYNIDSADYFGFNGSRWIPFWGNQNGSIPPCGTPISYEGQTYNTILIGTQCWMAENLNVGIRIDGTASPDSSAIEKYCYSDSEDSCDVYGGLYTYGEMLNGDNPTSGNVQGICPPGWHIPTDTAWKTLESYLGMSIVDVNKTGWRGTSEGNMLKETGTIHWASDSGTTNSSGFTALGGGQRTSSSPYFSDLKLKGYWWAANDDGAKSIAWGRILSSSHSDVNRDRYQKGNGQSVRCLRD